MFRLKRFTKCNAQIRAGWFSIIFVDVDYRFLSIIFDDFDFDVDFFYNRDFDLDRLFFRRAALPQYWLPAQIKYRAS
jgi:hypothetical protein